MESLILSLCIIAISGIHALPNPRFVLSNTASDSHSLGNETLSQYLWRKSYDVRLQALNTSFVQEIRFGNLDPVAFGGYMLQDAVWCEKVSEAMSHAAEKLPVTAGLHLRGFLLGESIDYKGYADKLYKKWHIHDASAIVLDGEARAYAEYEYLVADSMHVGYYIACMIPCAKLWPWLGGQLHSLQNNFGPYKDWVDDNLDPTYDGYTAYENFIDTMHANGEIDARTALQVYRNCMTGEADFFGSADA